MNWVKLILMILSILLFIGILSFTIYYIYTCAKGCMEYKELYEFINDPIVQEKGILINNSVQNLVDKSNTSGVSEAEITECKKIVGDAKIEIFKRYAALMLKDKQLLGFDMTSLKQKINDLMLVYYSLDNSSDMDITYIRQNYPQ